VKILCSISGLEFNCDYFPGTFYSKETFHPIFHLEQKRLLPYLKKWSSRELTTTDSYLLFIALLKSSDLIEFRVPINRNEQTDAIIYNNMEFLARTVIKLNTVITPAALFPRYAVTPDTRYLTNVHHWIENWDTEYRDFQNGRKKDYDDRKLVKREAALERLIKNPHKPVSLYAKEIAEWAAVAGEFPKFIIKSPFTNQSINISDFWKDVIIRCAKNELLYSIPQRDLTELIEHCEDKVPIGSIYSNALFKVLRAAHEKQKNFLGLGDFDVGTRGTYALLTEDTSVESANMRALIDSAPLEEPRQEQYPTKFKFLQAKLKWDMAKKYGTGTGNESGVAHD
jgi:hypothetical protein